jgi:glycosyltransferase involved in cell wall biosynthesis
VSVVITTFHREELVLEAIASVQAQAGVRAEIVVVDDSAEGSARAGVEAVAATGVHYVHRRAPSGGKVGRVRNEAVPLTRAPLVTFLDDDDRLCDGALAALASALAARPAGMAYGRAAPFGSEPHLSSETAYFTRTARDARRLRGRRRLAAYLLFLDTPFVNGQCMVKREIFDREGGYDETLHCCEDIELYVRIARNHGAVFVDRDTLHYRVGQPSIMRGIREGDGHPELARAYRVIHERYRAKHGVLEYRTLQVLSKVARRLALIGSSRS